MSIHVIQGKPGGGKSYQAVQRVLEAVQAGRVVVTNLPLKKDHPTWEKAIQDGLLVLKEGVSGDDQRGPHSFGFIEGWDSVTGQNATALYRDVEGVRKGEATKMGPLIIVDEAAGTLGEWSRSKKRSEEWAKFIRLLQVHRHYLMDIIFLYQDYSQLGAAQGDVKALVERWYTTTNTSEMTGANTWNMVAKAKGFSLSKSANLDEKSGRFKKEIFDLYDSYAEGQGAGTNGKKTALGLFKSKPLWLRWWFILLVICLIALPVFMFRTAKNITSVVRADNTPVEFGSTGTPSNAGVSQIVQDAPVPVRPIVETMKDRTNPRIIRDGVSLPAENLPFKGFDQNEIFFADGSRFSILSDFEVAGFRAIKMTSCDIRFAEIVNRPTEGRELLRYQCERGF
jgi:hypothetical protein